MEDESFNRPPELPPEERLPEEIPLQRFDSQLRPDFSFLSYKETLFGKVRDNSLPFKYHDKVVEDPSIANPIKEDMIRRVLGLPPEVDVSKVVPYVDLVETEGNVLRLFFEKEEIVTYVHSTRDIRFGDTSKFKKFANLEKFIKEEPTGDFDLDFLLTELDDLQVEKEVKEYVKETTFSDLEAETSLEESQFKIDEAKAREYQLKIQSLESELQSLKSNQGQNSEDQSRISYLENQIEIISEDPKSEIERLEQSLQLKSTQLLESQEKLDMTRNQRDFLEGVVQGGEKENEDLQKKYNDLEKRFKLQTNQLKEDKDSYITEKENLEQQLKTQLDTKLKEISSLVEENETLRQQGSSSFSNEQALRDKITQLNSDLEKTYDVYKSNLMITENQEKNLKSLKRDIRQKENLIQEYSKELKRLSVFERRSIELESDFNEQKKIIKAKQQQLDSQREEYDEKIASLIQERDSVSEHLKSTQSRVQSLDQEMKEATNNKSQLKKERDSKLSEVQSYSLQIKKLNIDINVYRNKIQSLEKENKNLKASASQSTLDYNKQIKDVEKKIEDAKIPLRERVKELETKVRNYKEDLDQSKKDHKKSIQKYKEESLRLTQEKRDLLSQRKTKGDSDSLRRKLLENENRYSLLNKKYEDSLFKVDQLTHNIDDLITLKEQILEREQESKEEIEYLEGRIRVKDKEVSDTKEEVANLHLQLDDAYSKISLNEVKQVQFDRLTSEYNTLVHKAQQTILDRDELELQLQKTHKELEETKSKLIPPHILEQLKHDVDSLNKSLNEKDRVLKLQTKQLKDLNNSQKQAIRAYDDLRNTFERRFQRVREIEEKKIRILRHKLKQTLRPGEIKGIGVILSRIGSLDFKNAPYEKTKKELISARDKYRKLSRDPNTPHANKFLFDHMEEHLNRRIDLLNLAHGKDIETPAGNDVLLNSQEGAKGLFLRMLALLKRNKYTIAFNILWSIGSWILVKTLSVGNAAQKGIIVATNYGVKATAMASPVLASTILAGGYVAIESIKWFTKHILEIVIGGITMSIFLIKVYGEEYSFPILAFWSIVVAYCIVVLNRIWSYVPESVKSIL